MIFSSSPWRNWGRSERAYPRRVERPGSADAVRRAVTAAGQQGLPIKAVGAGHSFTGIAVAPGVLLDLVNLRGVLGVNAIKRQVKFAAGTHLYELPQLLAPYGLALQNMGDIDRQTIAGAISTGTHGTGARFGGIATQIVAMTLVTGSGELLHVSETENAELLPAVRVGIGALGIIVDVTLQCAPAFSLHAVERPAPLEEVLESWEERVAGSDHFEFYWFPHTATAATKTNTRLPADTARRPIPPVRRWVEDQLLSNGVWGGMVALGRRAPRIVPAVNRIAAAFMGGREFTDASYRVFVSPRNVRFREMEYAMPLEAVPSAVRELTALIDRSGWRISFPVEVRAAAADENWLSTAHGRASGYVAVHRYYREPLGAYFREAEAIFQAHGGRPHWGKLHTADAEYLRQAYPRFDDFLALRDRLDPEGLFRNPYLDRVLGVRVAADAPADR